MRIITFYTDEILITLGVNSNISFSYYGTNRYIERSINNEDARVSTTSMANLSMDLFTKYNFDLIRILSSRYKPIYISYDRNTKKIECDRTDKELHLSNNLFKMWQNGVFNEEKNATKSV